VQKTEGMYMYISASICIDSFCKDTQKIGGSIGCPWEGKLGRQQKGVGGKFTPHFPLVLLEHTMFIL
jgi:hypothetical protein